MRAIYRPFEMGLSSPTGRVYRHEIPGGQLSNLRAQATALGLAEHFEEIEDMYSAADRMLGHIVKVTPSSKVVGDLALQLVGMKADPAEFEQNPQKFDIPDSVIGFLNGELGTPPAGWPEPFRTKALEGRHAKPKITQLSEEDREGLTGDSPTRRATLNRLLFPGPAAEYAKAREEYGDLSVLHTRDFLYGMVEHREHVISLGRGVRLLATLQAISEPDEKGYRTVMCTLNGQQRSIDVRDESVETSFQAAEKADTSRPGHVPAPFAGAVSVIVEEGQEVASGEQVATIEAMKMEASITAPVAGTVQRVLAREVTQMHGGDLVIVIDPA